MNEKKKPVLGQEAVTDARVLGAPRMLVLGLQHLFAMFGATVLVPILVQGYRNSFLICASGIVCHLADPNPNANGKSDYNNQDGD